MTWKMTWRRPNMAFEWIYRRNRPKFKKHLRRLVWKTPQPIFSADPAQGGQAWVFPTISKRKIRFLGRREVYPHSLHVHLTPARRIEEP